MPHSLKGKRILVTGGAGFIGSYVVERLSEEAPEAVVVVDNLFLGKRSNLDSARAKLGDRLHVHELDASSLEAMRALVDAERIDIAFDMAVIPLPQSLTLPWWTVRQNVDLTLVLCELLREKRFETLIHFSSSEVYGSAETPFMDETHPTNASTPYAASKLAGDALVLSYGETFGLDVSILRPFNNFGPRQNAGDHAGILPIIVRRVREGLPIEIFGDGKQTRDFIFVKDTAEAAVALYREPRTRGTVVNVASGRETSVNDLVHAVLSILGAPDHPIVHVAPRAGDVRRHIGGVERARSLWGFTPQTDLESGLVETVHWYNDTLQ